MSAESQQHGQGSDPSMADILASIRRILTEDDQKPAAGLLPAEPVAPAASHLDAAAGTKPEADVLVLDRSMLVEEPAAEPDHELDDTTVRMTPDAIADHAARSDATVNISPQARFGPLSSTAATTMHDSADHDAPAIAPAAERPRSPPPPLAEPNTVASAASSLTNLARSVAAERSAAIQRNGLSIEDVVREELRPLLKAWLDMHLPGLVERLVQAEIERVVNRATF